VISTTKSLWVILGQLDNTVCALCSRGGTEFSSLKVPELMQTILSMHAVLTPVVGGVLTGGAKLSL